MSDSLLETSDETDERATTVVSSHNEWDLLEEVIVGRAEHATVPSWHVALKATMPEVSWDFFREQGGRPFPEELRSAAARELDELTRILEVEGVVVRRPEPVDHGKTFSTPDWVSEAGLYSAMPRDVLLAIGDELIEVPMAWRCRYFETSAYRPLLKEYFERGARWTAAPKPELKDELFDQDYREPADGEPMRYVINELEPTFDAADFVRCGRDLFAQQSHVTNRFGIRWLERHLGEGYRIHVLEPEDTHPMHIDATFMPLAAGRVLVNPERVGRLPSILDSWEVLESPAPAHPDTPSPHMCSHWISMNVLSIDDKRVLVQEGETPLIDKLRHWGFEPIPCSLKNFNHLGGGFHCATLDVCRRGELESYF